MIITKLMGGLGNQMFQYAVVRALAHRHDTLFKMDISAYQNDPKRTYRLNNFNIVENIATIEDVKKLKPDKSKILEWSIYQSKQRLFPFFLKPYIKEQSFSFNPKVIKVNKNSYLEGYWQSDKYFSDCEDVIRQDFTLRGKPRIIIEQMINEMKNNNSVSLHIRRGDYVTDPKTNKFHRVLPLSYYYRALSNICKFVKDPLIYIFSDDIQWAKDNFKASLPIEFLDQYNEDYEDIVLMSNCKYHIIANSSFSWWGAWLGSFPDKMVIAPKRWLKNCEVDVQSLFPGDWLLL